MVQKIPVTFPFVRHTSITHGYRIPSKTLEQFHEEKVYSSNTSMSNTHRQAIHVVPSTAPTESKKKDDGSKRGIIKANPRKQSPALYASSFAIGRIVTEKKDLGKNEAAERTSKGREAKKREAENRIEATTAHVVAESCMHVSQ